MVFVCVDALHPSQQFQSCPDNFLSSWFEPVLGSRIKKEHNTVSPVSLKPVTHQPQV